MTAVVHVAGLDVACGPQLRQRCAWCGAVLIDEDQRRVALSEPGKIPTWPVGALVHVDGDESRTVSHVVERAEGDTTIPPECCMQLPHDVTGMRGDPPASTSLDRTRRWLDEIGIVYTSEPLDTFTTGKHHEPLDPPGVLLHIVEDGGPLQGGYSSFFADIEFDATGKLLRFGVWE